MRAAIAVSLFLIPTTVPAADATTSPDLAASISRLATAMEHVGSALEKQASAGFDARERDRVQVALGILGLRMRKVERLESGVQNLKSEADDLRNQAGSLRTVLSRPGMQEDPNHAELERNVVMIESRILSLEERRSMMQADLDRELRGLSRLEAILDDWLKKQD